MRRLGQALDRIAMTLYRYVPSKDALLNGVVARVLTDLAINPAAADWRQELRDLATSSRGLALAHSCAVPLLVTRPLTSPSGNGQDEARQSSRCACRSRVSGRYGG
jgi:AcrR family transcriptional regulator